MELALKDGDYVREGAGLRRVGGEEALLQRVLFRLTARRGTFPFLKELGSRLWQLGRLPAAERQTAARAYVAEALAEEKGLLVEQVTLIPLADGGQLTVELTYEGQALRVTAALPA